MTADYHMKLRTGELIAEIALLRVQVDEASTELATLRAQVEQLPALQERIAELMEQLAILRSVHSADEATNVRPFTVGASNG